MNRMFTNKCFMLFGLVFVMTITAWSQTPTFKNGVRQGQIKVKFTQEMTTSLNTVKVNARTSGFTTGIQRVDNAAKTTKASNMYRLFPYDPKYEHKLRKHGLHLWYVVEIDESTDPTAAIAQFRQLPEVAIAEVEHEKVLAPYNVKMYTPTVSPMSVPPFNDPLLKDQWHYDNTGQAGAEGYDANIYEAWQTVTGASNIIVAVHDQGVDVNHDDLKANIWINEAEKNGQPGVDDDHNGYIDDINGYNFQLNKGAVDPQDHGTHVAGTVAAVSNNGIGVAGVAGGNGSGNGVKIMSLQILGGAPIEKSYVYAANNGAVISQNSWGYTSPNYVDQAVLDAIDYFIAEAGDYEGSPMRGGIVLVAAGNSGSDNGWYPAYYPSTMAVASLGPEGKRAPYTNFGSWVDIAAPGGDQSSTYGAKGGVLSTIPDNRYAYMQGTSMACPHMSGIAALALANRDHQLVPAELWNKLLTGVVDVYEKNPNHIGKLGTGAVDAALAIKNSLGIPPVAITDLEATDIAQEFAKLKWTVPVDEDDAQPISFTIHYSTQPITAGNLNATPKVTIRNDSLSGKEVSTEIGNLLGLTKYYFTVISRDRWGTPSQLSNILELTTNEGPAIAITPSSVGGTSQSNPSWIIDASVSKTGTQNITIENSAAGLLRYSSFMRSRNNLTSATSVGEGVVYPEAQATNLSTLNVGKINSEEEVEKLYNAEPVALAYTPITKQLITGSITNLIGETDTNLPNSAAAKFTATEAGGFNLTQVRLWMKLTRAATAQEPIVMEIYNGKGPVKENLILAQSYTTSSTNQFRASMTLTEQLFFEEGESFWVVFHIPNGNLFPLGIGFDADPNYASECYYSSDVGTTWMKLDEALNDKHFAWGIEAYSANADLGTYLTLDPASADVSGMSSAEAVLHADANQLINGNYSANLIIPSNDAANPELRVPVYLKVQNHQPNLKTIDIADYNSVFLGSSKSFDLVLDNQGYGRITSMTSAGGYVISGPGASQFMIEGSKPFSISARDQANLRVTFAPTVAGPANATLTIIGKSGSGANYSYSIPLYGVGAETSAITATPESQIKTPLTIGDNVTADVTIENTGGYPLKYFIPGYDTKGISENWPSVYHEYGYKIRTNYATDPTPLVYDFQDIKETGVDITKYLLTTTTYYALDMGFNFPYYNQVMDTIYIAQKGFTTFDNSIRPVNTPPQTFGQQTRPAGYISILGTFLSYAKQGSILYKKEADRVIIQFDNVEDGSFPASITAQMVLFSNGDIRFYYEHMGFTTSNQRYLNILIEDMQKSDGIIFHNFYDMKDLSDGTAIGFDYPGPDIITGITNGSGVLAPGESTTLTVNMNTSSLVEGITNRYLNIISNDPANAQKTPLIQLDVTSGGVAQPSVSTDVIAFGDVFQGASASKTFSIKNSGTGMVEVSSMTFTNGNFTLTGDAAPLMVKPGLYTEFTVEIPTAVLATLEDDLVITYADASSFTIHVTGNVVNAPAITADLTSVSQTLNYKETASVPYSVQNTGAAPMEVSITGKQWATFEATGSTAGTVTYDVEKLNNGEVYQWVDIRKSGTHVEIGDVLTEEGFWTAVDLPFSYEFYGTAYDKVQIGFNGIVSFEDAPPVMVFADGIPSKQYQGKYIMPYWTFGGFDTFQYPAEDVGLFYEIFDDKIIIMWSHFENNFGGMGDPMSVQLYLYKNGTMKFQYQVEDYGQGGDLTSQFSWVGVQENSAKGNVISPKLPLDYGSSTGLAYILTPEKKHTVAAGESLSGDIVFNSYNLYGGTYTAELKIKSNVPGNELQLKPVELKVNGTPVYEAPDSIKFGQLMIGNPTSNEFEFEIKNTGSSPLTITEMRSEFGTQRMSFLTWVYAYNPFPPVGWSWQWSDVRWATFPITVGANETMKMMVLHNPNVAQNYNEGLIIVSNAGTDTIRVTSTAYRAPGLAIDTTPIEESMNTLAEVSEHKIPFSTTDTNNGQGDLEYTVGIEFGRPETQSSEAMADNQTSSQSLGSIAASDNGTSPAKVNAYNRTIAHTDKTTPKTYVGTGGSAPFSIATKYNSGPEGFSISHVETFFNPETLTEGMLYAEVRAGGTSVANATKVASGSVSFTGTGTEGGSWVTIAMDKVGAIYPNEDFYVIVTSPLGIQYPQGVVVDESTTNGRYFYYDLETSYWYDLNMQSGFRTYGWMTIAAEETAGNNSWLYITSDLEGSQAPGVSDSIRVTIDSHFAMPGDQVANIVFTTNDPAKKVTYIPVSLHVNEAPHFSNVPEQIIMAEGETHTVNMNVVDREGNTFTVAIAQSYPGVTHTFNEGVLAVTLAPDYGQAGDHAYIFTATDEHNAVREISIPVEIIHTNRAPQLIADRNMNFQATGNLTEYAIGDFFADPDDDEFVYTLSSSNTEAVVVFASKGSFLIKPVDLGESKLAFEVTDSYGAVTKDTVTVTVDIVLGAEESLVNNGLSTYPNPATQFTTVTVSNDWAGDVSLLVMDAIGRRYLTKQMEPGSREAKLDVSKLPNGIYIIKAASNTKQASIKFIKK